MESTTLTSNLIDEYYRNVDTANLRLLKIMEAIIDAQFKLGKQLGNGAFGIIYEGTCIATDRKVAIKMVRQALV